VTLRASTTAARALTLVMATGCYSYRAVAPPVRNGALVVVRYVRPHSLSVVNKRGYSARIDDVTAVSGRVRATRGDTFDLDVRYPERRRVPQRRISSGTRTSVVPDRSLAARQAYRDPWKSLLALGAVTAGLAAMYLLIFLAAGGIPA
jgi:hypothetical protein